MITVIVRRFPLEVVEKFFLLLLMHLRRGPQGRRTWYACRVLVYPARSACSLCTGAMKSRWNHKIVTGLSTLATSFRGQPRPLNHVVRVALRALVSLICWDIAMVHILTLLSSEQIRFRTDRCGEGTRQPCQVTWRSSSSSISSSMIWQTYFSDLKFAKRPEAGFEPTLADADFETNWLDHYNYFYFLCCIHVLQ